MKTACIFPGQGSQAIGMSKDLYDSDSDVKALFHRANEVLGFNITELIFNGPDEELKKTENTQPALLLASYAAYVYFKKYYDDFTFAAGHSLGEYTAHVAAGSLSFEDALKLVRKRGEFMAQSSNGTLCAVMGLDLNTIKELCNNVSEIGTAEPAIFNSPNQIVVAGNVNALEKLAELCSEKGGKATVLNVSGAFHSSMMKNAREELEQYMNENVKFNTPKLNLISNALVAYVQTDEIIKRSLSEQMTETVMWTSCFEKMIEDGCELFVEFGPGIVLKGLARRIDRKAKVLNASSIETITKTLETFKEYDLIEKQLEA